MIHEEGVAVRAAASILTSAVRIDGPLYTHRIPDPPPSSHKSGRRPKDLIRSLGQKTLSRKTLSVFEPSLRPALASPSTLNTPLHALNCTAFTSASAADNILPTGPGPRAV